MVHCWQLNFTKAKKKTKKKPTNKAKQSKKNKTNNDHKKLKKTTEIKRNEPFLRSAISMNSNSFPASIGHSRMSHGISQSFQLGLSIARKQFLAIYLFHWPEPFPTWEEEEETKGCHMIIQQTWKNTKNPSISIFLMNSCDLRQWVGSPQFSHINFSSFPPPRRCAPFSCHGLPYWYTNDTVHNNSHIDIQTS